jgi:hypothetical protein
MVAQCLFEVSQLHAGHAETVVVTGLAHPVARRAVKVDGSFVTVERQVVLSPPQIDHPESPQRIRLAGPVVGAEAGVQCVGVQGERVPTVGTDL